MSPDREIQQQMSVLNGVKGTVDENDGVIGLDVEQVRSCTPQGIQSRFFHPDERAYVEQNGDFFRVWTAKESYVKYTGEGITDSFASFSTVCGHSIAEGVRGVQLKHIPVDPDYRVCVCAKNIGALYLIDNRNKIG